SPAACSGRSVSRRISLGSGRRVPPPFASGAPRPAPATSRVPSGWGAPPGSRGPPGPSPCGCFAAARRSGGRFTPPSPPRAGGREAEMLVLVLARQAPRGPEVERRGPHDRGPAGGDLVAAGGRDADRLGFPRERLQVL